MVVMCNLPFLCSVYSVYVRDDNVWKIKEQEAYLEDLWSQYWKKLLLIESSEYTSQELQFMIQW